MKILEGKNTLITGGGRGIGKAVALDFANAGANVAVAARTLSELDQTVKEIEEYGVKAISIQADLSTLDGVSKCAQKFFENFENCDVLVANAGMTQVSTMVDYPLETAQKLFNLNILGTYAIIKHIIPNMIERKCGKILITSSVMGNVFFAPKKVAYATSKAAIAAMGKCLNAELKPYNIVVNSLTPAGVETKMAEDLREWGQQMPITNPPEMLSPAYLYLASDLPKKKYHGKVIEINWICEALPVLKEEIGTKDIEKGELSKIAEEKLKKHQYEVFKENTELIDFMLKYER
ncbi:MAG: SDR family NAD(P)-dependent oxidoreductase [Candidatus Thorarchaeota archaeon]